MAGTAAYTKCVKVWTGSAWATLGGKTSSLSLGSNLLDDTELCDNEGYRSRVYGLNDWSVSLTANYEENEGNTELEAALKIVRDALIGRDQIYVQYLPSGAIATGFQGPVKVESFNMSGDVDGLEDIDISLQADGAIEAADSDPTA